MGTGNPQGVRSGAGRKPLGYRAYAHIELDRKSESVLINAFLAIYDYAATGAN